MCGYVVWQALVMASFFLLTAAGRGGAADRVIPAHLGWHELPSTALRSVCPPNRFGDSDYPFFEECKSITAAWNSAVMDTRRNRLVVWGGGHTDYLGNELYALDLRSLTVSRLTDPGLPLATSGCPEALVNGTQPNARHTYDALAYIEHVDRLWTFSGSLSPCGFFGTGTWTFDFGSNAWEKRTPKGETPMGGPGIVSAYDPVSGKVFLDDGTYFYSYDFAGDRYERLAGSNGIGYHSTAVIDPIRRKFVIVGAGRVHVYDIAKTGGFFGPSRRILGTKGGDPVVRSIYPGLAFDPVTGRIVAWNGGDTVYSLDLETAKWAPITYPGGPGRAMPNGTYKRWSYAPGSGVFAVINAMTGNAFTFRLTPMPEAPGR
jgi:hypothetical protein